MNSLQNETDLIDTNSISLVNWHPGTNPKLSLEVLTCSIGLLLKAFPTFQLDPEFAWEMLCDLPDRIIERAVLTLIQTQAEVYPSTNWIALIRTTAIEQRTVVDDLTPEQHQRLKQLMANKTNNENPNNHTR